jgi:hypothetical protein
MELRLYEAMNINKTEMETFFRQAHVHAYGCDNHQSVQDVVQFKLYGILPLYVREYVTYVLERP